MSVFLVDATASESESGEIDRDREGLVQCRDLDSRAVCYRTRVRRPYRARFCVACSVVGIFRNCELYLIVMYFPRCILTLPPLFAITIHGFVSYRVENLLMWGCRMTTWSPTLMSLLLLLPLFDRVFILSLYLSSSSAAFFELYRDSWFSNVGHFCAEVAIEHKSRGGWFRCRVWRGTVR